MSSCNLQQLEELRKKNPELVEEELRRRDEKKILNQQKRQAEKEEQKAKEEGEEVGEGTCQQGAGKREEKAKVAGHFYEGGQWIPK